VKEKDLYVDFEPQKSVYYVEKNDNTYGPIISGSQLSANYLDDFYLKRKKLEESLRKQMINNEISPVFYYMTLLEMGPKDLATRLGISSRKLRRIFKPEYFMQLNIIKLKLLADIFNIPVSNLFQTFEIDDKISEKLTVEQLQTDNKCFHIIKISQK
jgi:transcriptional regulator with XRE-family HTH domain